MDTENKMNKQFKMQHKVGIKGSVGKHTCNNNQIPNSSMKKINVTNVTTTKVDELNKKTTVLTDYSTATACYYSLSETENLPHFINVKKAF